MVALVALQACQNVEAGGQNGGAEPAPLDYPSLNTVPPRPQLSYPVQQRRAIVQGLIADLENARYTSQVVRFRTGRSNLPPPPEPQKIPAAVAEAIIGPDQPAPAAPAVTVAPTAVIDDAPPYFGATDDDDDDGTLSNFIRDMVRETEPQPIPGVPSSAEPTAPDAENPAAVPTDEDDTSDAAPAAAPAAAYEVPPETPNGSARTPTVVAAAAERAEFRSTPGQPSSQPAAKAPATAIPMPHLRPELPSPAAGLGVPLPAPRPRPGEERPTDVAMVPPPAAPGSGDPAAAPPEDAPQSEIQAGLVAFAPGSANLTVKAEPELARLLADAERDGLLIDIIGEAKEPSLALDRARAVALALIKLGAGPERLRVGSDPEPSGDRAWIILADPL